MKLRLCKIFSLLMVIFYSLNLYALVPVDSLVFGNFSAQYSENESDPLFYLFKDPKVSKISDVKGLHKTLAIYRGFAEEGKNLEKFCKKSNMIEYPSALEQNQVERSLMATLQYIILDITSRALPQYAKYFEFSREEYANLVEGVVGNYCSVNLSVISKKELKNNLLLKFDKENTFSLPSVADNQLFPPNLKTIIPERTARENEFKYTVKVLEYACSWGGDPKNPGLLLPFLKDSTLMAFIIRQMSGQSFDWNEYKNLIHIKNDERTQQVWCDGLICRKSTKENFEQNIFHSVGSIDLSDDLQRLYCEDLKMLSYLPKENDPKLARIMNSISLEEEIFLNSQLMALLTGVPDFLLGSDKFNKADRVFQASIDQFMEDWAKTSVDKFSKELFYEESLTLELVERKQYFNKYSPHLNIVFDANLGEFDRINQSIGKIKMIFEINVLKSYLSYYRQALIDLDPRDTAKKEQLFAHFKVQIFNDVEAAKEKLIIPPWKGDLAGIIVKEISEQLLLKRDTVLKLSKPGFEKISVEINYGPFALKYINHQFNLLKDSSKLKK